MVTIEINPVMVNALKHFYGKHEVVCLVRKYQGKNGGMELETELQKFFQAVLLLNGATLIKEFGINSDLL